MTRFRLQAPLRASMAGLVLAAGDIAAAAGVALNLAQSSPIVLAAALALTGNIASSTAGLNPTFTSLGGDDGAIDTASGTTTSVTLTANRLCLLTIVSAFNNGNTPTCDGWDLVGTVQEGTIARITVLRRMVSSDLTQAHTYSFAGQNQYYHKWSISQSSANVDISGANGANAVVGFATNSGYQPSPTTNGLNVSVTLAAFSSANNSTFAAFGGSYPQGFLPSPGSGFETLAYLPNPPGDQEYGMFVEYKAANDTVADATWSGVADVWVGIALEVKAGGDIPAANPLPAGALSFTVAWDDAGSEAGYIVYVATSTQGSPDPSLYPYRYLVAADVLSLVISGVASGTKYVRVAAYQNGYVGDLSFEQTYTPA